MENLREKLTLSGVFATVALGLFMGVSNIAPVLTDVDGTTAALKAQNLEPVDVGGGEGDFWRTKFEAKNASGETVKGYGTSGVLKGTTLRFD